MRAPPMPKAVVFDFDGVIIDSVQAKANAFAELFSEYPVYTDKILALHFEHSGVDRYEKFQMIYRNILEKDLSKDDSEALGEKFQKIALKEILMCPFILGAKESISEIKNKLPIFICSATPELELCLILEAMGIKSDFTKIFGSPNSKEKNLEKIRTYLNCHEKDLTFVGDARADRQAAAAVGANFIGVRDRLGGSSQFSPPIDFPLIDDLRPLPTLLGLPPRSASSPSGYAP